jgi:hypothetical protein
MPHYNFDNILHATITHKTKDAIDSHFFKMQRNQGIQHNVFKGDWTLTNN